MWGIIPAAGMGTRIQPLAFSKELLPVGSHVEDGRERPRAISEYLIARMIHAGVRRICMVIAPGKSDIVSYYGAGTASARICYTVQPQPQGLCDALFRPIPFIRPEDMIFIGLPDTVWFPENGFSFLPSDRLSFLLFPVEKPAFYDAVLTDEDNRVQEIRVKQPSPGTNWIWGAVKLPGSIYHALHNLWIERDRKDVYLGSLVNAFLESGGMALGIKAGSAYVDVGTIHGYKEAIRLLGSGPST